MVKRRQTNRTTLNKRKVYRRKTRGGQPPPSLKNKPLPNPHLRDNPLPNPHFPSHLRGKPLPNPHIPSPLIDTPLSSAPNPSPEYVSPHPPSPLFRHPSHSPPKSKKSDFLRHVKGPYIRHATSALPEVLKPSPQHSPIHGSPHPPSPLFKPPSHIPPTDIKPSFSRRAVRPGNHRRTKTAKLNHDLQQFAREQQRISNILRRGSSVVDDAGLERAIKQYEHEQ